MKRTHEIKPVPKWIWLIIAAVVIATIASCNTVHGVCRHGVLGLYAALAEIHGEDKVSIIHEELPPGSNYKYHVQCKVTLDSGKVMIYEPASVTYHEDHQRAPIVREWQSVDEYYKYMFRN